MVIKKTEGLKGHPLKGHSDAKLLSVRTSIKNFTNVKCVHNIKQNNFNSIYCDLLGWISPKACDTCRIQDFKRATQEAK